MATQGQPASWADEVEAEGLRGSTHGSLSWISWSFVAFLIALAFFIVAANVEDAALLPGFALGPIVVQSACQCCFDCCCDAPVLDTGRASTVALGPNCNVLAGHRFCILGTGDIFGKRCD
eukprot:671238-Rhodomonas_salina.1